jgi:peroxiredoxin
MTVNVGDKLPNATLRLVTPDGAKAVTTEEYFAGKRVALFGLPGAFTPGCHINHLPGFIKNAEAFKAKGIDAIAMTSVNDGFVLAAWSKASGADGVIDFLGDGNADFAKAIGLAADFSAGGMGVRSKRYSMLVENGIVKQFNLEVERKVDLSSAEHLLAQL